MEREKRSYWIGIVVVTAIFLSSMGTIVAAEKVSQYELVQECYNKFIAQEKADNDAWCYPDWKPYKYCAYSGCLDDIVMDRWQCGPCYETEMVYVPGYIDCVDRALDNHLECLKMANEKQRSISKNKGKFEPSFYQWRIDRRDECRDKVHPQIRICKESACRDYCIDQGAPGGEWTGSTCYGACECDEIPKEINKPPVAHASVVSESRPELEPSSHITVEYGETVILSADESYDSDGEILNYRWFWDGTKMEAGGVTQERSFPVGKNVVTLEVEDNKGAKSTDTVVVTVTEKSTLRCVNVSGNVLEEVLFAPIRNVEVRLTSIEGPPGVYSTNENTTLARITPEGDYYIRVPPGVYSICAMAYGYIPSRGLGGERMERPTFDFMGRLNTEHRNLRLLRLPCTVFGNVTDNITELPINKAHVSLDGPPHIYPPHPNVKIKTETNASGKYRFILTFGVHPGGLYNISVSKSGYLSKTQNFTLNWSNVITDYYKCPLSPLDYNPPIVNFSLPPVPSELPDLTLARDGIQIIFNGNIATISATIHNIGTADASNIVVQFFDGDPDAGGTQIGTDRKILGIAHDSSGTVQVTWTAIPGTHDIFVRVDPYNTIQEAKEDNNQAYKQITIGGAKTIYVDDDFTDDPANHRWDTIQEGISDADDGDTVLVYNGTYTETVTLNKTLTLTGEGMPKIDAHGSGYAIHVTADNCTVKGFCCVNARYAGISVESSNNVIEENTCRNNYDGIYLSGSSNEIRNNIANYNNNSGITLSGSDNNRIIGNDASNNVNQGGIYLYFSNNNEIRNNCANENHNNSIKLMFSDENVVANNTAKNNGDNGIYLVASDGNRITDNAASSNVNDGISLFFSDANNIAHNTAKDNGNKGIFLSSSSSNNTIYLNNFVDNLDNAFSSWSSNTTWHSPSTMTYTYSGNTYTNYLGNYWSDYKGSDADGDGIGDSSYSICSSYIICGDADFYPLMKPWESYFALQVNWPPHNPTLIPDKPEPQPAGTAITWSASATEPDGDTLYYRFWIKGPSTGDLWTIIQDWSTDNTLSWHTTTADIGDTDIAVWIRDGHHEPTNSHDLERVISNYQIVSGTCKVQITSDPSNTDRPSIVYANGFYYVAYQSIEKSHGIYIKKFDYQWKFKKKVEVVSGSAYYDSPSLAFANNKLYVAYISNAEGANKNDYDVIVKGYNPNSFACTSGEKYLTTLQSCQDLPALYYKDGYFYLAYQSRETGNGDIYIKKFDSNWNQLKQVRVTSKSSLQDGPSITYANGYFYVAYYSMETDNRDIFVKRLNTNLNLDVFKKQITFETSRQTYPSIAFVNNQFAIAYASTETGTWGIYMKKYDNNWNFIEKMKVVDDNSAHERQPAIIYAQNDFWIAYVRYLEESDNWYTFVIIPGCE